MDQALKDENKSLQGSRDCYVLEVLVSLRDIPAKKPQSPPNGVQDTHPRCKLGLSLLKAVVLTWNPSLVPSLQEEDCVPFRLGGQERACCYDA